MGNEELGESQAEINIARRNINNLRYADDITLMAESACMHAKSLQLCPTLCDSMDCNPPGSSVYGILQARILEWVATSSSNGRK